MNIFDSMQISASGLNSQRAVIGVIAENMANAHTTRTEEGGPYLRKKAILSPSPVPSSPSSPFSLLLAHNMGGEPMGVKVADIVEDIDGVKTVYDPSHPDADETGIGLFAQCQPHGRDGGLTQCLSGVRGQCQRFQCSQDHGPKGLRDW